MHVVQCKMAPKCTTLEDLWQPEVGRMPVHHLTKKIHFTFCIAFMYIIGYVYYLLIKLYF